MNMITGLNDYQALTDTVAVYPGSDPKLSAGIADMLEEELRNVVKSSDVNVNEIVAGMDAIMPLIASMRNTGLYYTTFGLAGEAGEFAEKVKKMMRDSGGVVSPEIRDFMTKELGDIMWYVAQAGRQIGVSMEEIATKNMEKLLDRKERGVLCGSGDAR